jgi:hypothetical protein
MKYHLIVLLICIVGSFSFVISQQAELSSPSACSEHSIRFLKESFATGTLKKQNFGAARQKTTSNL